MTSLILLSSSPPRIFARTPTPAGQSSPNVPRTDSLFSQDAEKWTSFKPASSRRDGFRSNTRHERSLQTRHGAENLPMLLTDGEISNATVFKHKIRPVTPVSDGKDGGKEFGQAKQACQGSAIGEGDGKRSDTAKVHNDGRKLHDVGTNACKEDAEYARPSHKAILEISDSESDVETSSVPKAIQRRTDWTPAKPTSSLATPDDPNNKALGLFAETLSNNFAYLTEAKMESVQNNETQSKPVKRRRIETLDTNDRPPKARSVSNANHEVAIEAKTKKRPKSTSKKSLTITGLATSHYVRHEKNIKSGTMLQHISVTQMEPPETCSEESFAARQGNRIRMKATIAKAGKTPQPQSRLLSPESAIRVLKDQDTFFGSASQLARDESPAFTRDTIAALKISESFSTLDPLSPNRTQPVSVGSTTPKISRGTSRYSKSRNLWSAAGRDEDNALLHVDTVDLSDNPLVRLAFAGKDVLLEPPRSAIDAPALRLPHKACSTMDRLSLVRNDAVRPFSTSESRDSRPYGKHLGNAAKIHKRDLHTPSASNDHERNLDKGQKTELSSTRLSQDENPEPKMSNAMPAKPSYLGYSTEDLRKQLSSYGFKPVKKREKMIELLDKCWDDKFGSSNSVAGRTEPGFAEVMKQGDFLSKVHAVSARPEPKVTKSKRNSRKKVGDAAPSEKPVRRKRKSTGKEASSKAPKSPRKASTKSKTVTSRDIVDVDDLDDSKTENTCAVEIDNIKPAAAAPKPSRISALHSQDHSEKKLKEVDSPISSMPALTATLPDIKDQIRKAIIHDSKAAKGTGRNHVKNPTWHEKMLLYDPIILEDLTLWLNTEGFRQISEDREVSSLDVRDWCETNAVCCLWKGGRRGQRRKSEEE